jgi:hypothetical protein
MKAAPTGRIASWQRFFGLGAPTHATTPSQARERPFSQPGRQPSADTPSATLPQRHEGRRSVLHDAAPVCTVWMYGLPALLRVFL